MSFIGPKYLSYTLVWMTSLWGLAAPVVRGLNSNLERWLLHREVRDHDGFFLGLNLSMHEICPCLHVVLKRLPTTVPGVHHWILAQETGQKSAIVLRPLLDMRGGTCPERTADAP